EGLDQTRGWFYTLMVLSTALFDKPAFKNVVVNGLILAEDGKKMSKRLRNYPMPDKILDDYGADALRLYLINSGLVKAEDLRFSERGVRDIVRLVILPLWNAYKFFVTYAVIDGYDPQKGKEHLPSDNILDQWILSRVETLNRTVREEMDNYRLYKVVPALLAFVEDLTNWYIRLNRRRYWQEGLTPDKMQAYATFYHVLVQFSLLLAPFTPFMAEEMFGNLTGAENAEDSVHLQDFPVPAGDKMDEMLEHTFALMQEAIVMGRALREKHKHGVRQPLPRLTLIHRDSDVLKRFEPLVGVISEELNIKDISFARNEFDFVSLDAKPNLKVLGPRFGQKMKKLVPAIKNLRHEDLVQLLDGKTLTIEGEELDEECFLIQRIPHEGLVVSAGEHISIALDLTITNDLRLEGLAREAINRIQRLRKDSGLEVQDRIVLSYETDHEEIRSAFTAFNEYIATETLAVTFSEGPRSQTVATQKYDIQDFSLVIHIDKA
ncbi:class I tRNA ligase family protein, partial [Myxococcota bacterium]|nr:class I tRNA ligase family protein [Myxococcota bacterium]